MSVYGTTFWVILSWGWHCFGRPSYIIPSTAPDMYLTTSIWRMQLNLNFVCSFVCLFLACFLSFFLSLSFFLACLLYFFLSFFHCRIYTILCWTRIAQSERNISPITIVEGGPIRMEHMWLQMAATVDLGLRNTQDPNTELSHDNTILRHPNHDLTSQYTTIIFRYHRLK